jgi:hypothetical protein
MDRPSTPISNSIVIVLILAWFALLPVFFIAHGVFRDRWMIQDTWRIWAYMGVVASVLFLSITGAFLWLTWTRWEPFPWRVVGGFVLYSLFSGWSGSNIAINVLNHSSTAAGQVVEFKIVHHLKGAVEMRAVGEDYDGIGFRCSTSLWTSHYRRETGTAPGIVYRGRLGLLWGEFRDK